jgi:hypothetical protein
MVRVELRGILGGCCLGVWRMISEQYVQKSNINIQLHNFGRKKAIELLVGITMMGNHSDWLPRLSLQHMVNGAQLGMVKGDDKIGPHCQ